LSTRSVGGQTPEALVFDLDGTLVDSAPDIRCSLNSVLNNNGLPSLDLDAVTLMIGGGPEVLVRKALDKLGVVTKSGDIGSLSRKFQAAYHEQGNVMTTTFRGALECLEHLKKHGIPIGLCSNKPERICHQLIADLEIQVFFSEVQGSGTGLPTKPEPDALLALLRRLGATPARSLYVGDSKTDVETARRAGVPVALVDGGYTDVPATTLGADWVVKNLADIPSIWQ
jgi:phosphoglycolate phosphatase